eukprot:5931109-Pleurochrysis_carterae.AAC.1
MHVSPASGSGACARGAAGSPPRATAAANAAWTASAAWWFPPAAAMNCATSCAGRLAPSSDGSSPMVHSSPARCHVAASSSPAAPRTRASS